MAATSPPYPTVEPGRAPAGKGRELLTPWGDERVRSLSHCGAVSFKKHGWPPTSPERRKLPDQEAFSGLYLRRYEMLSMQQSARIGTVPLFNPRFQVRSESFGRLESGIWNLEFWHRESRTFRWCELHGELDREGARCTIEASRAGERTLRRHGSITGRAFPGDNRGEAPTTCSFRLLNALGFDFRF